MPLLVLVLVPACCKLVLVLVLLLSFSKPYLCARAQRKKTAGVHTSEEIAQPTLAHGNVGIHLTCGESQSSLLF